MALYCISMKSNLNPNISWPKVPCMISVVSPTSWCSKFLLVHWTPLPLQASSYLLLGSQPNVTSSVFLIQLFEDTLLWSLNFISVVSFLYNVALSDTIIFVFFFSPTCKLSSQSEPRTVPGTQKVFLNLIFITFS